MNTPTPPRTYVPSTMPNGYNGIELKPDTVRPGSMDQARIPSVISVINGQRVERK